MTSSGTLARVVFDESHSEAWTIRPELARTMQPAHPADASYARAAEALAARDFEVAANVDQPLSAETLSECEVLVIAHPSDPRMGADDRHRLAAPERGGARRDRGVRGRRRGAGRARRDRAGEVRQQPQRAAGALRPAPGERHRAGLRALPRGAELDPGRAGRGRPRPRRRPAGAGQPGLPVSRDDDLGHGRRGRAGPDPRHGVLAREAADRGRRAWPRPRGRAGRLRPVRRRLHRRARPPGAVGEPRLLGDARGRRHLAGPGGSGRRRPRARPGVDPAARGDQRAGGAAGRGRFARWRSRHGPRAPEKDHQSHPDARAALPARRGVPERRGRGPARLGFRQARLHARARAVPARAPARGRDRAPGRVPDVQAERLARHVLRGADRPGAVARLDRRARGAGSSTTPSSCRSS